MKYTIKNLGKMIEDSSWFDTLLYWMECGNMNMVYVFDNMSKKETLQVIDKCVSYPYVTGKETAMNVYKCAMTSLEKRL